MNCFTISKRALGTLKLVTIATAAYTELNLNTIRYHLHDLGMNSSESVVNKIKHGNMPKLTHAIYDKWNYDILLMLTPMKAYAIVTGDNPKL